jgi:hypothetical protein
MPITSHLRQGAAIGKGQEERVITTQKRVLSTHNCFLDQANRTKKNSHKEKLQSKNLNISSHNNYSSMVLSGSTIFTARKSVRTHRLDAVQSDRSVTIIALIFPNRLSLNAKKDSLKTPGFGFILPC